MFRNRGEILPHSLARAAADEIALNDTAGYLSSYSLVRRTGTDLVVHRVVQSALRGAVVRLEGEHPLAVAVNLLHDFLHEDKTEYDQSLEEMERWTRNLPHVLAVIDSQVDNISINANSMAWLTHHAGRNIISVDPRSEKYLRRAVLLDEGL